MVPACVLCGSDEPLGTGLCTACIGSDSGGWWKERLLFLERSRRGDRREVEYRIRDLVEEDRSDADIMAATRGELPVARVPADIVDRVARHLRESGLPVRVTHPARIGARLSPLLGATLGAAIGLGVVAGLVSAPSMLMLTLAFGLVVAWAAIRRQGPSLLAPEATSALPAGMEDQARQALASMPDGAARRLLGDFVRMTRELYGSGVAAGLEVPLTELLNGAGRLASDLAGIDHSLEILESQAQARLVSSDWSDTETRIRQVRDRLENRLLDALTALARARSAGSEGRADEDKRLAEIAQEIARDAELQAEAHRDLEALLA